jgi:hypothetical protein
MEIEEEEKSIKYGNVGPIKVWTRSRIQGFSVGTIAMVDCVVQLARNVRKAVETRPEHGKYREGCPNVESPGCN